VGYLKSSPDAITWTEVTTHGFTGAGQIFAIAYGAGVYVLVGNTGGTCTIQTSPDLVTWSTRTHTFGVGGTIHDVIFDPSIAKFIAVGFDSAGSDFHVETSVDGITWVVVRDSHDDIAADLSVKAFGGFVFACGQKNNGTGQLWKSNNTAAWSSISSGYLTSVGVIRDITYGLGLFVTGGLIVGDARIETSLDTTTWFNNTHSFGGDGAEVSALAFGLVNNIPTFVAVGNTPVAAGHIETARYTTANVTFAEFKDHHYVDWASEV
jgi:hypothetical protein